MSQYPLLDELTHHRLWQPGQPLRLHLGCGETYFQGYINIDYPPSEHNVMEVKADVLTDILALTLPESSVDEVRLHHVFEHFSRVTALAMLIRWHRWLKVGGVLRIATPDFEGSAKTFLQDPRWNIKMGAIRALTGDQAAAWAYHIDHWFAERFRRTLGAFGFDVEIETSSWPHEPYLCNIEVLASKRRQMSDQELMSCGEKLLEESMVAEAERPTWEVWRSQLHQIVAGAKPHSVALNTNSVLASAAAASASIQGPSLPLTEIHDFNQLSRDNWIKAKAATVPSSASVLDIGAGTCPYRSLFAHAGYKTHDFKQYTGEKLGGTTDYGHIDYVSDIAEIPIPDGSIDIVLCTEVFEHVPEPIAALREISRILRPGGRAFITAPLGSGLHQLPFHFYGGYTPHWYEHFGKKFGLNLIEVTPNGGFFRHLAQECVRSAGHVKQLLDQQGTDSQALVCLLREELPRLLFDLERRRFIGEFTVGYQVELRKPGSSIAHVDQDVANLEERVGSNRENIEALFDLIVKCVDRNLMATAAEYARQGLQVVPGHAQLEELLIEVNKRLK